MAERGFSCATCDAYDKQNDKQGVCKRNPPQVFVVGMRPHPVTNAPQPVTQAIWPAMGTGDWCAAHNLFGVGSAFPIDRRLVANADGEA